MTQDNTNVITKVVGDRYKKEQTCQKTEKLVMYKSFADNQESYVCKPLTFFENPLNIGLVSGGSVLAGLTAIPVLLKLLVKFR